MIRRIALCLMLLVPVVACAQLKPGIPVAGKDYVVLSTPQPTWGTGGIEVAEVFSYSCSHCAQFQPLVNRWKPTLASDVKFRYVPAVFGGVWDTTARAFLAAEAMGVQARTHDAIFKAFFIDRKVKTASIDELAGIYAGLGVDGAKFKAVMNGTTVSAKLNRARQFSLRAGVDSTPTLIINGKYRVTARTHEESLKVAEFLIAKERAASAVKPR